MAFNLKEAVRNLWQNVNYRLGGGMLYSMEIPPGWSYQQYLRAYGEIGWLFGAVSLIASSVAEVDWHLYVARPNGEREEIDDHPLLDMWQRVNPFQTKYQFIELLQMYIGLVGEAFIVLGFNGLRTPAEMWLAPPQYMAIKPDPNNYISHYEYKRGGQTLRLEIPEVIHIQTPNPLNPYRGLGTAQSIGTVLDNERYSTRYTQRLFYNDATPGLIISSPGPKPPKEERDAFREEWEARHMGWRNAHKTAFLWGDAKASTIAMTNRDMDFWRLRKLNREDILGAYHIPTSLMGLAEVGSRARAEADEYIFAKRVVKPALTRIREAMNEQLCPLFDSKLKMDFENPIPENLELLATQNREDFKAGSITREEARVARGLDARPEKGDTFLIPFNLMPETAKSLESPGLLSRGIDDEHKEMVWRLYAARTEAQERIFKRTLKRLFNEQADEVIGKLSDSTNPDDALFNEVEANETFQKAFHPLIEDVYIGAAEDVLRDLAHRGVLAIRVKQDYLPDELAREWLLTRSLQLARMVNGTTREQLRKVLAEGFAEGESIPKITRRIREFYQNGYEKRAPIVARTEVIAASNEGALQGYEQSGVGKAEFYAALDERTCEECMALHGNVYPVKESHGIIPVHPQCRCVWIPVVE